MFMGRNREVTWDNVAGRVRWDRRQGDIVMVGVGQVDGFVMRQQLGGVNDVECRFCRVVRGRRRWGVRGMMRRWVRVV